MFQSWGSGKGISVASPNSSHRFMVDRWWEPLRRLTTHDHFSDLIKGAQDNNGLKKSTHHCAFMESTVVTSKSSIIYPWLLALFYNWQNKIKANLLKRYSLYLGYGGTSGKESACQRRRHKRHGFDPWVSRSPGWGHGNPPQYSCLENPKHRGVWWSTVHGYQSQTRPRQLCTVIRYYYVNSKLKQTHDQTSWNFLANC